MFSVHTTYGYLFSRYSCGVLAGLAPLWEAEGDREVELAIEDIWPHPAIRPTIMFYDRACKRRRYLLAHPDPSWAGTINIVYR